MNLVQSLCAISCRIIGISEYMNRPSEIIFTVRVAITRMDYLPLKDTIADTSKAMVISIERNLS